MFPFSTLPAERRRSIESYLDRKSQHYYSNCYAPATRQSYGTHRRSYVKFCNLLGYTPVPATTQTIVRYVAFLSSSLSFNSVKQYTNIIRIMHREWNLPNPLDNNYQVASVLRGLKRDKGCCVSQKAPITPQDMLRLRGQLNLSLASDANVWAAALVLFFGVLRKGSVLPPARQVTSAPRVLSRDDVFFHRWGVLIRIRYTKTIQFRERHVDIPLPRIPNHPLCPVRAITHAFQFVPRTAPDTPAFVMPLGPRPVCLTGRQFVARVQECLARAGADPSHISGHSFRRGGASWAYSIGVPTETIRAMGDWKSHCYMRYITINTKQRIDAVSTMIERIP